MNNDEKLASALVLLEEIAAVPSEPPAMVVMAPYSGSSIVGNRGGFVHLAIASLKASSGQEQSFRKQPWATVEDLDWTVDGLKYDPAAHIYLPKERRRNFVGQQVLGFLFVLLFGICLVVGLITIVRFLFRLH